MLILLALPLAYAADADTFQPAASLPTKLGSLQGEAPQLAEGGFSGGVGIGMATNTVVRTFETDRPDQNEVALQVPLVLHGGYTVEGVARFDVVMPLYALSDAPLNDFVGPAAGDLRLQATVPLFDNGAVQFGVVPRIELPTGSEDAVVTEGFAGTLLASLGGDTDTLGWVLNAGPTLAASSQLEPGSPSTGSSMRGVVGGWWHASTTTRIGAELDLATALARADDADQANRTGAARLFAQEVMTNGVGITASVGTGLIAGIGTPDAHGYLSISYAQLTRDTDGDGLTDDVDVCPSEPEDVDGFADDDGCPEPDNDEDGILDLADRCPMVPEDVDGWEDDDGCVDPDNDADGVLDADDRCPVDAGTVELMGCPDTDGDGLGDAEDACPTEFGPKETQGCPDRDGDLVPDHRDRCPDEPRPAAEDPATSDGCPKIAYVGDGQVTITERVEFDTGKSTLKPESERILSAVAEVITSTPSILRLEVQGHTDNVGSASSNQRLSDDRAAAVRAWLIEHGVPRRKLSAKGYGEDDPIDSNRTAGGREANRRVQFKILEMAPTEAPSPPAPEGDAESPWGGEQGSGSESGPDTGSEDEEVWGPSGD
jgi:outer membrane protein OmpA-like peptidoglycan-associated protein